MLCVTLSKFQKACGTVTGGIAKVMVFDPYDFDWTQTTTNGVAGPYTAVARRTVGSSAAATAVLSGGGTIASTNVSAGGTGYTTAPTVAFSGGGGTGAAGTATISGGAVTGITITNAGTGYTSAPTIAFSGGGGTGATATATLSTATLGSITVSNPGTGYTVAPVVTFSGGGGTGATATAQVINGEITGFTVTAPGSGYTSVPTVVLTPVANTGKMYPYSFQANEAEYKWSQTKSGPSSSYALELDFQLAGNNHTMTNVLESLDAAAACCGLGFVVRLNDGTILVFGELYVGGEEQIPAPLAQDGSSGGSGKLRNDPNVANLVFKGTNSRLPYEYTGTWLSLQPYIA